MLLLAGLATFSAGAQSSSLSTITGAVQTEQGGALVGAAVMALHQPTGIRRTSASNLQGAFELNTLLSGGPYALQVIQPGFRTQVINDIFLQPGQNIKLTLSLVPDLVAVGTRRRDRSGDDALASVDVIDMRQLILTGAYTDNTQLLKYEVPSFNSNRLLRYLSARMIARNFVRSSSIDPLKIVYL